MKYTIPTLMALSQDTGVVCNWTESARECGLIRPSQRATPVLRENPQNRLPEDPSKSLTPVKGLPHKTKTRRGRRAKRTANTAAAVTFAPSEAGFAQFLKEHSSPRHQRVTAGGRIVPMPFIEDSEPAERASAQPATTHGPGNEPRDTAYRLNELIGQEEQDEQTLSGRWLLSSVSGPTATEAPRTGLLPGFDPARDGHPNADPFVRSLRRSGPLVDITMNRMHPLSSAQQGRTGGNDLAQASIALQSVMGVRPATQTMLANQQHGMRECHMAQTSPGRQNAMSMHPPVQMVPLAQQYGMGPVPGFYPTAQIATIVPQYAMGVGHMAQSYAPPPNMMMMHPSAQMMPVMHQPGMGFSLPAQMAPIAQQNSIGVGAMPPAAPAQMTPIVQQNSMDVRAMPPASDPMQGTTDVHGVTETRPAARATGMRLNPTAPEFVHGATVRETNPARNPAPAQGVQASATVEESQPVRDAAPAHTGVQARDTVVETQPIRDAALAQTGVQANVQPSWPPVTPPSRTVEVQTPLAFDSSVLSPEGRPLNRDDFEQCAAVLWEVVSLILENVTMPIDEYERRLLFLVNLIISTRENERLRRDLLTLLRNQEECLAEKLHEVNREIALFELNSRRQPQLQSRPDFVALRVYWSLVKGMTATAIEHLERIGRENAQGQSQQMAEEGGERDTLREAEERADFEAVENALARFSLPLDPEMTIADSQFELARSSSDNLVETDGSEQDLNRRYSIMETIQEVNEGENEASEPYECGNDEANEASQPSPLGEEPQPANAETPSQAMGENGARDASQADEAIEAPATVGDTSPRPHTAGPSSTPGVASMDKSPGAGRDMSRREHRRVHSQLLVSQLANRRVGRAPVLRAVSTTAVSPVHAFDGASPDGPARSHD